MKLSAKQRREYERAWWNRTEEALALCRQARMEMDAAANFPVTHDEVDMLLCYAGNAISCVEIVLGKAQLQQLALDAARRANPRRRRA